MQVGSFGIKARASKNAGFTLVELLVVIVIISILAAITFPVFTKAKEGGRITQCLQNMKQLGLALTAYLDTYDSRFPAAAPWGAPTYWGDPSRGYQRTLQQLLKPYVRNGMEADRDGRYSRFSTFVCPSDSGIPGTREINGVPPNQPIWRYAGCSYEYYAGNQIDWQLYNPKQPSTRHARSWTGLSPEIAANYRLMRVGAPLPKVVFPTRKAVLGDTWFWHQGDIVAVDPKTNEPVLQEAVLAYRNTLFADCHAARVTGAHHDQARIQTLSPWHNMKEVAEN